MLEKLALPLIFVSKAIKALLNQGPYYCIVYSLSYIYLWISQRDKKSRFDLYDVFAFDDPEKLSFFIPKEEWRLESPQRKVTLEKNADSVSCFGINSKSEFLSVHISRKPNAQVHCSILLQLADGKLYTVPEEQMLQKDSEEPHSYGSARVKMECLQPMRRWRVFFNGTMCEKSADGSGTSLKHVKFAFLIVASSGSFDHDFDLSHAILADTTARQKTIPEHPFAFIRRLKAICNGYSQCGMFLGNVEIEGQDAQEIYLWGNRNHYLGKTDKLEGGRFREVLVNAENGIFLYLRTLNIPGIISEFHYGYVMRPNGYIDAIDDCQILNKENSEEITCQCDEYSYKFILQQEVVGHSYPNHFNGETLACTTKGQVSDMKTLGLICSGTIGKKPAVNNDRICFEASTEVDPLRKLLCLPIHDKKCQLESLSGGKGSSLSKLHAFSKESLNNSNIEKFEVPKGIVVTTSAYAKFSDGSLREKLSQFEKDVWKGSSEDCSSLCERAAKDVLDTSLPESVIKSVETNLKSVFGEEFHQIKFAVRSSATGEDTEQMSAAGQMVTYLGVKGLDQILQSLKKCWASQFGLVAVQYKRRYGQLLDTPMAVVIQEMVKCDIAGVAFTCDPVSGNPAYVTISANYGLGESVVAASADPDTIKLERNLRDDVIIHSKHIGSKKSKVVMTGEDGVEDIELDESESSECCLIDEMSLKLGKVAVEVERYYGNPRDIEWGILDNKIFLLQARPVTSIAVETDFEIKHASDTCMRVENEYTSKANVGEVMCGSSSILGGDLMGKLSIAFTRYKHIGNLITQTPAIVPYFPMGINIVCGHVVFMLSDAFFRFDDAKGKKLSEFSKAMSVALLGRVLEDERLCKMSADRHKSMKNKKPWSSIFVAPILMFFGGLRSRRFAKKFLAQKYHFQKATATEIFDVISRHYQDADVVMMGHMECTFASSFWNLMVLTLLSKERGSWDNELFGDFAYLLSSCTDVESADVPAAIQHLSYTISQCIKPELFKKMTTRESLDWLKATTSDAGKQFQEFLERHGHRGIKEFDVYEKTWDMNYELLVSTLQGIVSEDLKDVTTRKHESASTIISKLHVKPAFFRRMLLKFCLYHCQRGVREREFSKSVLVKGFHKVREAARYLAKTMVHEGRLPNEDLLFFLNFEEIRQLLRTRSPRLVAQAFRRWKAHPELDKLIFPEICVGVPKPVSFEEEYPDDGTDLVMEGVPVSQGVVTARACVILSVTEATIIKSGDVLITYATDIGWSPYFPLLSGVVTELGGLVSHGAVVAREYGLPCVVNLHGATRAFKTGDIVQLDGNKGILKRLKSAAEA